MILSACVSVSLTFAGCAAEDGSVEEGSYEELEDIAKADGANSVIASHWRAPAGYTLADLEYAGQQLQYAAIMNEGVARGFVQPPWRSGELDPEQLDEDAPDFELDEPESISHRFNAGVMTSYAATAGIVSQLDTPAPGPGDLVAIAILAWGLGHALITPSDSAGTQTGTQDAALVDELVDRSCNSQTSSQAAGDCSFYFHYTDFAGYEAIMASQLLRSSSNWVYATWIPMSPTDVRTSLVFQNSGTKGDYVVAFYAKQGVPFQPAEAPLELKHWGAVRFGSHIDVFYAGRNPLP